MQAGNITKFYLL